MTYYYESRIAKLGEFVKVLENASGLARDHVGEIAEVIEMIGEDGFCKARVETEDFIFHLLRNEYKVQVDKLSERICSDCGIVLDEDDEMYSHDGETFCETCYHDNFGICDRCENMTPNDDLTAVVGCDFVCETCLENHYTECHDCGRYHRNNEMFSTGHGDYVCSSCFEDDWCYCADCDEPIRRSESYYHNDNSYCEQCHYDHNDEVIGDYHHTEVTQYFSLIGEHTKKYIGFELEVEERRGDKQEAAANVLDLLGRDFIECKHDGSLSDGFEVVTQPATYAYHLEQDYENALEGLRSDGMRSHDPKTCGLHFHVSKLFLVDSVSGSAYENIAKMLVMMNYLWEDIVKFSRRNYNELDEWAKKTKLPLKENPDFISETIESNSYDRYQALNIKNRATVEFRFFRGTLRAKTFRASMEWVHLFTEYAISHSLEECFSARWNDIFCNASENFKEYSLSQKIGVAEYDHDRND